MTRWATVASLLLCACGDDRAATPRGTMPAPSATTGGFYARPALTTVDLRDAALWRCTAVPLDEAAVGHPPPGAAAALYRRRFALRDCAHLRGPAGAPPTTLTGFTMLAPTQRHDDPAVATLSLDGQRFFDAAGAAGPVLLWVGGPTAVPPMGFEGNAATVDAGAAARPLALTGADAALAERWPEFAGWRAAPPAAAAPPLIALDELRVARAQGDHATAAHLQAQLDADGQPAEVRAAARATTAAPPTP